MSEDAPANSHDGVDGGPTSNPTPPIQGGVQESKPAGERKAIITNPEALSDPEYSDEDAPPVDEIAADEGECVVETAMLPKENSLWLMDLA